MPVRVIDPKQESQDVGVVQVSHLFGFKHDGTEAHVLCLLSFLLLDLWEKYEHERGFKEAVLHPQEFVVVQGGSHYPSSIEVPLESVRDGLI